MRDLVKFLLARFAEDEERGRSLVAQWFDVGNACQSCGTDGKRLLAECEAKQRIVTEVVVEMDALTSSYASAVDALPFSIDYPSETLLRLLALPYADHPDFREEWRP